jgi:hypothetical protein
MEEALDPAVRKGRSSSATFDQTENKKSGAHDTHSPYRQTENYRALNSPVE